MIGYEIGMSGQSLVISGEVLHHFSSYRQLRWWHREAGGQLFARFEGNQVLVTHATGPRQTDRRARRFYHPDRMAEQREVDVFHQAGHHFIGTWHTHPEDRPTPSAIDIDSISEAFRLSKHALNGFVLAIVGRSQLPAGLYVGISDGAVLHQLKSLGRSPSHHSALVVLSEDLVS
ncbi:Mov34/MPN/PAD-1 family protein [Azorhizobium sp. AG788]|uniref:Mov34/MPN/PAD-1 family protein n=1 Tax=Azorhizobium sp. AG788 TaxID=2183897 RepID=UPI00313A13FD